MINHHVCVCVSNLAHRYPQILHRNCAALLHGLTMTFFCGYICPLSPCSISITTQHAGFSKLSISLSHHTISPSCDINQELQRLPILPWTFHEFLLEVICILSCYNPTSFSSDLTPTFCLTVLVYLNPPTGIYLSTDEK